MNDKDSNRELMAKAINGDLTAQLLMALAKMEEEAAAYDHYRALMLRMGVKPEGLDAMDGLQE